MRFLLILLCLSLTGCDLVVGERNVKAYNEGFKAGYEECYYKYRQIMGRAK